MAAKLEITDFKLADKGIEIRFMSEFALDETFTFYIDGGFLRCRNKHMSREFMQSVLAKAGELLILDGIGR